MDGCFFWLFQRFLPPGIEYFEAQRRIRSFDLVYFCQLGVWTGPFVALFSGKMITHMGVAYRCPDTDKLYVLESVRHADTACDVADHNRVHSGVRLVTMESKLRNTNDRYFVCVQPIIMDTETRRRAEALLPDFIRSHIGVPFKKSPACFITAHLNRGWWGYQPENTPSLFCSELAALTLIKCGLLDGVPNVSAVWHTYFWCNQLTLRHGARLSTSKFLIKMRSESLPPPRPPELIPLTPAIADRLDNCTVDMDLLLKK